jgi:hypothetical protein
MHRRSSPLPQRSFASLLAACGASATMLGAAFLLVPAIALAEPEVVIYVSGGGEGITVTLTDVAGTVLTCRTDATGSCEITGAAPGRATVTAQGSGAATSPRTVMIADGKVSVFVPSP